MAAVLATATLLATIGFAPAVHAATPFAVGDVMAGVGSGSVKQFDPTGVLKNTLVGTPSTYTTGMAFDAAGNLYTTDFSTGTVDKYDTNGNFLGAFITGITGDPESLSFDAAGNLYVGRADGPDVFKYDSTGTFVTNFAVARDARGSDWIDLAADQCTLFYTSEGLLIKRFDVCTNTQLADFATLPSGEVYALRIRPNGDVIVAATSVAYRLNSSGVLQQTYTIPGASLLFGMNLDPDGTSFWTGDLGTGAINRIDIATGAILKTFSSAPFTSLAGLAVVGEIRTGGGSGTITVTKDLIPSTDSGLFNLQIDAATAGTGGNVGDGGTTGPIEVTVGNHDVAETAGTGTVLTDYTSSISCTEEGGGTTLVIRADPVTGTGPGPVSVPVANGDNWTCIITNTRNGGGTTITDLSQVHAWIGLKNSDDQGTQFDLLAELQKNGSTVASGLTRCITGLTRNASQAKEALVNWNTFAPITVAPGDIISIVFSTRIGTTTTGAKCAGPGGSHNNAVGLRLYYDSLSRPSRFDMTVSGSNSNEYLHSDGGFCDSPVATKESQNVTKRWFDSTAPTLVGTKCKDSSNINFAGGNLYKVIGTWYQQ